MRTETVQGRTFQVDDSVFSKWETFELVNIVSDEGKTPFERVNAMFALVEAATSLEKADIIEMAGGEGAEINGVFAILGEVITKAAPKN